jgi:Fe-S-cluster containining protein
MKQEIKQTTPLKKILAIGAECKQCGHCCKHGTGFVLASEAKKYNKKNLEETEVFNTKVFKFKTKAKPFGACMFLKRNKCSIHKKKPLHCRVGTCSEHGEEISVWFALNYLVNVHDPESIRQWNIYLKSGGKNIPGGSLKELVPDKKLLKKILSYEVLK